MTNCDKVGKSKPGEPIFPDRGFLAEGQLLPLPRIGAPCNGCGACCLSATCGPFKYAFGPDVPAPCPALVREAGGRYRCGMLLHPQRYFEAKIPQNKRAMLKRFFAAMLGTGSGCEMVFTDEDARERRVFNFGSLSGRLDLKRRVDEANRLARKLGKYLPYRSVLTQRDDGISDND